MSFGFVPVPATSLGSSAGAHVEVPMARVTRRVDHRVEHRGELRVDRRADDAVPYTVGTRPVAAIRRGEDSPRGGDAGSRDDQGPPAPRRPAALAPLNDYLDDPRVTDVFVNSAAGLWVDRGTGAVRDPVWIRSEADVRALAVALVAAGGRHLDEASPCVDVRLGDGVRVHAVLPPISTTGTLLSVRVPHRGHGDLDGLRARGMFDLAQRRWLGEVVAARTNVLLSGAAGSGKTTLLAALLAEAAPRERIVTIEDVAELRIAHPHHVALEARQPNLEGAGAVGLDRLVREALRMRPDRLVVGECRGVEVAELLSALNTGHDGGAGTVHANSLADVPARLEALGALAGLGDRALARQAVSAIGLVLHVDRRASGVRTLQCAGRLGIERGRLRIEEVRPWL